MMTGQAPDIIRSRPFPDCCLCDTRGQLLYRGLTDRLYNAPGEWSIRRCPNRDCGLLWLDPMPLADDIGQAYETYFTHNVRELTVAQKQPVHVLCKQAVINGYLRSRLGYRWGVGPLWYSLLWPLAYLHPCGISAVQGQAMFLHAPTENLRLLEVGFGKGDHLAKMSELGWDVEGIEIDLVAVKAATARGLTVRAGRLEDQDYPSGSFDSLITHHVLEHVEDPVSLLTECRRILKPGGVLVAVVPNSLGMGHRCFGSSCFNLDPPRHLFMHNRKTLRHIAEMAGLSVERLYTMPRTASWVWHESMRIRSRQEWKALSRVRRRIMANRFLLLERAMLVVAPDSGDEAVIIARS